ncbi:MAG TPA: 3-dehydroquinate synthase [Syntrophorhabdaceae bacterium]|nr:3-dehydroquinate synthase [Syntrophorhabdaceae bacterium]HQM82117.1 3-dehydroquinate synthase [Syntrophorhabdaceae bacterium]
MKHLEIKGRPDVCRIEVGVQVSRLESYCDPDRTVIITDGNVRSLHGRLFRPYRVIETNASEESKILSTVEDIYEKFLHYGLDRTSFVAGVGGGIVCDVAGFAASTYLRGLPFGFVPTTLLAQVDAAVGGKNGVNYKGYKNLIGTFNQPRFVLCDHRLLATLPVHELRNGFAEIIKHALIADAALFLYLEERLEGVLALDADVIEKVIYDSISIKAGIVSADETEKGERRKLNFGHTFGHALELSTGLGHGEAVSVGMVMAARLSETMGILAGDDVERIERILENAGLPFSVDMDKDLVMDAIDKDKKRAGEEINLVLLDRIGAARVVPVKIRDLREAMDDLCQHR